MRNKHAWKEVLCNIKISKARGVDNIEHTYWNRWDRKEKYEC